jgi:hypothetical protein
MALFPKDEFLWGEDAKRLLSLEDPMGFLIKSEPWAKLKEIGEEQKRVRHEMLLSPRIRPEGPSDDFLKGAIFGINLLLSTPYQIMEAAKTLHGERAKDLDHASN